MPPVPHLKYVETYLDRHGKRRWYYRKNRGPRFALPDPGTGDSPNPAFARAYAQASNSDARIVARARSPLLNKRYIKNGVVYFLRDGKRVKIGFTINLSRRLQDLHTGRTEDLTLILAVQASQSDERMFHKAFADQRLKREWFAYDGALKEWIEARLTIPAPSGRPPLYMRKS